MLIFVVSKTYPRNLTGMNIALYMYKNHFCLLQKSQNDSFTKRIKELITIFKVVDDAITDKHIKNSIILECKPKKEQSQLITMIIFDLDVSNTNRCVPHSDSKYKLSNITGKLNRDITQRELEKK